MSTATTPQVLIIDDETEFALALADRLELRGMQIRLASAGAEGLVLMQESLPHVVLLDMRMPGMSGIDVLHTIRNLYGNLPVIVITGHCSEADHAMANELGVQGYHTKPLEFTNLVADILTNIPA